LPHDSKFTNISKTSLSLQFDTNKITFFDELKINLPLSLTAKHHLLFTVVGIEKDKKTGNARNSVIGYAFFPLLKNGKYA
jgi:hypothetical protein